MSLLILSLSHQLIMHNLRISLILWLVPGVHQFWIFEDGNIKPISIFVDYPVVSLTCVVKLLTIFTRWKFFLMLLNPLSDPFAILLILTHAAIGTLSPIPILRSFLFKFLWNFFLVRDSIWKHAGLRTLLENTINIVVDIANIWILELFSRFLLIKALINIGLLPIVKLDFILVLTHVLNVNTFWESWWRDSILVFLIFNLLLFSIQLFGLKL